MRIPFLSKKSTTLTSADDLSKYLQTIWESYSGVQVTPTSAMQCSTVYACVRVLSTILGSLPLHMFERDGDESKKRVFTHPALQLLTKQPNGFQSAYQYWQTVTAQLMLWGNHYSYKSQGTTGPIQQLLPLDPGQVDMSQKPDWSVEYKWPNRSQADTRENIFHITGLAMNGYQGISPVMQNREAIGLALAIERHQNTLFKNGLMMEGVLRHPKALSETAYQRLKTEMMDKFQGPSKSGGTMILEEGLEYEKITQSATDAQLLQSRKHQRTEIAGIWGIPPHKLADLEKATFTNIEHQNLDFVIDVLDPYIVNIEQAANLQILSSADQEKYYFKFNVDALLRGDFKSRMDGHSKAIQWGIFSPNEARNKEDLPAREGGDEYLKPLNMVGTEDEPPEDPPANPILIR